MFSEPIEESNSWNLAIDGPSFLSTDQHDKAFLSLSQTSPAIDQGREAGLSYLGKAPDLGALEFGLELFVYDAKD